MAQQTASQDGLMKIRTKLTAAFSGLATLDQVTQQNAALVEQSAAAAESLKQQAQQQAQQLVHAVAVFKLAPAGA